MKTGIFIVLIILLPNINYGQDMAPEYKTINLGGVNCYLVQIDSSFILIDNGYPAKKTFLDNKLKNSGCKPGNLKLVILTHGDFDHVGNSAFLREKYGAKIAMHADDSVMVTKGDMHWNRKKKPDRYSFVFRAMSSISQVFFDSGELETFSPDIYIDENFELSACNWDAQIIHTPGHSKGSISVLTGEGYLFCGDLIYNLFGKPRLEVCDNMEDFKKSVEKLKKLEIERFYPGHGKPFSMEEFLEKF
jgi:glyoxylase-like metal-dependent hydrolase (beta-lactamase superfamily II)